MRRPAGFTLVEVLVAIALLGVAATIVWWMLPNAVAGDARRVAAAITRERQYSVFSGAGHGSACEAGSIVPAFMALTVSITWPPRGLFFTPDGLPRTCDGGGVGNTTILLKNRGRQAAVIVSSLGRVRWELR